MRHLNLLVLLSFLMISPHLFAEPIPVYGNTYDVNDPASSANAADFNISTNIRTQISGSASLLQVNPQVFCKSGVVTFVGKIQDINQAIQLIQIAESTPGVVDVVTSRLTDQAGNQLPPDVVAVAKIKGIYVREKLFGTTDIASFPVSVSAVNVVVLTGTVDTQEQADAAISFAKSVGNVTVKSEIKVKE